MLQSGGRNQSAGHPQTTGTAATAGALRDGTIDR
jgi:hypothetical protein